MSAQENVDSCPRQYSELSCYNNLSHSTIELIAHETSASTFRTPTPETSATEKDEIYYQPGQMISAFGIHDAQRRCRSGLCYFSHLSLFKAKLQVPA